jgi:ABC-type multidrug transport system ATPase subunit
VRLWGALSHPETVVFTPSEYRGVVAGNPTYAKYLASLALSQSHLFIGASTDTIEEYLSAVPRTPSHPSSRTHYALVPEEEEVDAIREVFKIRHGVELLVFRPSPGWSEVRAFLENLARTVSARAPAPRPIDPEAFRLKALKLENIGPFKNLLLEFDQSWNVLLGNNGAGKSTILRALALVLCGDDTRALIEGARLLRSKNDRGAIELVVGNDTYRTELTRDTTGAVHVNVGTRVSPLKIGRWVALAFPPLRGVSINDPRGPTTEGSPSPVIDDVLPILVGQTDSRLSSLKQWLVNLEVRSSPGDGVGTKEAARNRKLRDHFFELFNAFVPGLNVRFANVDRQSWQVNVITNDLEVGIDQLSQGTSSILGWAGSLLQRMYEIHGADKDVRQTAAVVLLDELDAHLHPDWQQRIVSTLKEQFPNVQFIATTHSPLIVGELDAKQIYCMQWKSGEVLAERPTQPIQGMGLTGLLRSEMFGLTTTVDKKTDELLEQQRQLSAGDEPLTDDQRIALEKVNTELENLGFRYQVRDPQYTEYLKKQHQIAREMIGDEPPTSAAKSPVSDRVEALLKSAVARATRRDEGGDS